MKKQTLLPALAFVALVAFAGSTQAQTSISVPNFSFEDPAGATSSAAPYDLTSTTTTTNFITDWTLTGTVSPNSHGYGYVSTSVVTGGTDGSQAAYIQVYNGGNTTTLATSASLGTITANTTYTLTVAIGAPTNFTGNGTVGGAHVTPGETAATATFSLTGNGASFASDTIAENLVSQGSLTDYTVTFTTGASGGDIGDALGISLTSLKANYGTTDPGLEADIFDNVRLTQVSTAPEPRTWALLLGSFGFLGFLARRNSLKA